MSIYRFLSRPQIVRTFLAAFALAAITAGLALNAHAQSENVIAYLAPNITYAGVVSDSAGNLYGVTYNGGDSNNCGADYGCGTVFELSPAGGTNWTLTTIYNFQGLADGAYPLGGLTRDSAGNLYGTNLGVRGGHVGVAFELSPASGNSWKFTPLYSFERIKASAPPSTPLTIDSAGNLYGITYNGGRYSNGSAFELSNVGGVWTETLLHSFGGPGDGSQPYGPLVIDAQGNLYGTTSTAGSNGRGTVFELSRQTSGAWKEDLLYTFPSNGGISEAGLIFDSAHNLYGTTSFGGADGYGSVFRLTRVEQNGKVGWKYIQLYSFTNGSDGSSPASPLTFDASGNLYGTDAAPESDCSNSFYTCGQVYKLTVGSTGLWSISALYPILASGQPSGSVVLNSSGDIFGTDYDNQYFGGADVYEVIQ
jgi:uncharacterized repeat protein (TIGR03803 family)